MGRQEGPGCVRHRLPGRSWEGIVAANAGRRRRGSHAPEPGAPGSTVRLSTGDRRIKASLSRPVRSRWRRYGGRVGRGCLAAFLSQ
jgi:hypothetical protein